MVVGAAVVLVPLFGRTVVAGEREVGGGDHPDRDEDEQQGADLATAATTPRPHLARVARHRLGSRYRVCGRFELLRLPVVHGQIVRRSDDSVCSTRGG